jgi:riboflavin kinase/FMN adenylyltransferase
MAIHTLDWQDTPPPECRSGALTVGNFDGVHKGHAGLVAEVCRHARETGGPGVVLTFDSHPLQLLRPDRFLPVLTTMEDRARLLLALGADEVVVMHTTPELLRLSAEDFYKEVIRRGINARVVVEGTDFGFGHKRGGDIAFLRRLADTDGVRVTVVEPVLVDGVPASSSRVRNSLAAGDVEAAARMLGRPYRLHGTVCKGQRRGRTLGFPTANLDPLATFPPGEGVYAVRVVLPDQVWAGAANLGPNPTFGESSRKVEVHLIDFEGDLYGKDLAVDFLARLRDTCPFKSVAELRAQLDKDVEQARGLQGLWA